MTPRCTPTTEPLLDSLNTEVAIPVLKIIVISAFQPSTNDHNLAGILHRIRVKNNLPVPVTPATRYFPQGSGTKVRIIKFYIFMKSCVPTASKSHAVASIRPNSIIAISSIHQLPWPFPLLVLLSIGIHRRSREKRYINIDRGIGQLSRFARSHRYYDGSYGPFCTPTNLYCVPKKNEHFQKCRTKMLMYTPLEVAKCLRKRVKKQRLPRHRIPKKFYLRNLTATMMLRLVSPVLPRSFSAF